MKSQESFVIDQLKLNGYISRNLCLQERITRLGAIICDLKKVGWDFDPKYVHENGGKNFYYYVTKSPLKLFTYVAGGKEYSILK
ncbi:hypothetical protein M0R04_13975 [Candidatus Dojkabacteria bacterium]|jgi:hypothetical protein|nr:hypothetical protein [Candidatus Dojkabacteria bacterium]